MSGIYFLVVLAIWIGLSWALWKGWRRWRAAATGSRRVRDTMAIAIGVVWFGASFWYAGGQKLYYDMLVNRLCNQDGGIKVYETVKLPAERFDKYDEVHVPTEMQVKPGDEFFYVWDVRYIHGGNPALKRNHFKLYRRSDKKLLAEGVGYVRSGGDAPGPWQESAFHCPEQYSIKYIKQKVLIKSISTGA